jgi:hypothetical protein
LAGYTMIVLIVCHFSRYHPISFAIKNSFGDERVAWLFVGLVIDQFARLYRVFDPPKT